MRKLLLCCVMFLAVENLAGADAHHQVLSHGPIQDSAGQVIGFRAVVLVDPQHATSNHATLGGDVRLALGGMKYDRSKAVVGNANHHRDAVAGTAAGYVLHQLKMREITGPNPTDRGQAHETLPSGGQLKEVEVEVLYKDAPHLIPGTEVDLVAGFWKNSYWHVWGAADSPTTSSRDFVIKLPGTPSRAFLDQHILTLEGQIAKAQADVTATQHAFVAAQLAHGTATQAHQTVQTARLAPQQALQQANQKASADYQQAVQVPQAAYNATVQAAQLAYNNATGAAQAVYQQTIQTAQANLRAAAGNPNANIAYQQAIRTAQLTLQAATTGPANLRAQTLQQANVTLSQATQAARLAHQQATQAAQGAYNAAIATTAPNHLTITQQLTAATVSLQTATQAKANADATLKGIHDKIAVYKGMLLAVTP